MKPRILVVDDERTIRRVLTSLLEDAGYEVATAESSAEAVALALEFRPDVALLDLRLGGPDGIETMTALRDALTPAPPTFLIMTAHGTIRSAVEAMKQGAFDYITKPFDNDELQHLIARALDLRRLERRVNALESQVEERFRPSNMIGYSAAMSAVFRTIGRVAPLDTSVLVSGESGTGKELVARAIHHHSRRKDSPFIAINCGAIPETLIESTFFGHERGAFTDARTMRRGAFEEADGGTLFLDEVGELSPAAQAGLLRALQEGEIRRVGGERTISVDLRIIAATNRDLQREIDEGNFREDLYWRLNVVALHLPPLRERPEEIPALADHFIARHAERLGVPALPLDPAALPLLIAYDWPGNVRELENAIESALALATGEMISSADLPPRIRGGRLGGEDTHASAGGEGGDRHLSGGTLPEAVARAQSALEERLIRTALAETGGNRTLAAGILGISRKTLFNKMRELGIAD